MLFDQFRCISLGGPGRVILPLVEGFLDRDLFRDVLFELAEMMDGLAHVHRDVPALNIVRRDDGFVVKRVDVDSMAERKTKEKRERRSTDMATGKNELKQAKVANHRRMKLKYKSNATRRAPTRFTRSRTAFLSHLSAQTFNHV